MPNTDDEGVRAGRRVEAIGLLREMTAIRDDTAASAGAVAPEEAAAGQIAADAAYAVAHQDALGAGWSSAELAEIGYPPPAVSGTSSG